MLAWAVRRKLIAQHGVDRFEWNVTPELAKVWKVVDGTEILVHSAAPGTTGAERLLIRGKTAGLTGINVVGVGTLVFAFGVGPLTQFFLRHLVVRLDAPVAVAVEGETR